MLSCLCSLTTTITCYECESSGVWIHLTTSPSCDTAPLVRDKVPVFCEKRTEVVDNTYVTTRGCSVDYRWEDVRGYQDIRGGQVPCIRRKGKETCLCTNDRCNTGERKMAGLVMISLNMMEENLKDAIIIIIVSRFLECWS